MNTQPFQIKPTFKPLFWSLFGAGGMIAALILPAIIIIFSFILPYSHLIHWQKIYLLYGYWLKNWLVLLMASGISFLILWHCVHRFYCCLHDCNIAVGNKTRLGLYGFAIISFLFTFLFAL